MHLLFYKINKSHGFCLSLLLSEHKQNSTMSIKRKRNVVTIETLLHYYNYEKLDTVKGESLKLIT